ncbi:hypothetical protein H0H87_001360, partial [Tephrocybe sp. NHM501043]
KENWTPLHFSAQMGYLDIVKFLVEHGKADINLHNDEDMTPILIAEQHGHQNI